MSMQVLESDIVYFRSPKNGRSVASLSAFLSLAFVGVIAAGWGTSSAFAQDPDPGSAVAPAPSVNDRYSDNTTQLILRSIRDSNPQSAEELAKSASVMLEVDLYGDARLYLSKILDLQLTEDQMFELQQSQGSDFFAAIHVHPQMQPEGKTLATQVLAASTKVKLSPARLNQLIKTLNSQDISVRSEAFRKLRRIGEPAVAELVNVFAHDDRKSDFPGVRGALQGMGVFAQAPLLGGARASDLQVQTESIRALTNYQSSESIDVMVWAYLSPKFPAFIKQIASDELAQQNFDVDPTVAEARLYDRSMDYLLGKRQVSGGLISDVTIWDWDTAAKRMVSTQAPPATAARIIAARRASDLFEIRPDLARNRELYLLTQLESAKRISGASRLADTAELQKKLNVTAEELDRALVRAMDLQLVPAAVACCEMMVGVVDEKQLAGRNGRPSALVQAILFGDRHLQYAAFNTVVAIDPQDSFPGSSYLINLAIYLSQSRNRSAGLVGHNRNDIGQSYAASMGDAGLVGQSVSSSRDFFEIATSDPDVSVLMVSDTLDNPDFAQLIQQLRSDWRTRRMPIVFLYRDDVRDRWVKHRVGDDPMFCSAPFSANPELILSHIERLNDKIEPWGVVNSDRRRHAASAVRWLAKISNDRKTYRFYNLGNRQKELAQLLYRPGFIQEASQILCSLGTPDAQRELVNFASQMGLPADERQIAAEAFVKSVKIGGTLLTTAEIRQQYDRYNASESATAETQRVLATILDAIEARKNSKLAN
ncbi:MAG: hypothetical protein ACI87E_000646 [Mariniblastus sp.]|jgi:hypothetical protein